MILLMVIGGAVLVSGLLALVVAIRLRPNATHRHITVAELRARLAAEHAAEKPLPATETIATQAGPQSIATEKRVREPIVEHRRRRAE